MLDVQAGFIKKDTPKMNIHWIRTHSKEFQLVYVLRTPLQPLTVAITKSYGLL